MANRILCLLGMTVLMGAASDLQAQDGRRQRAGSVQAQTDMQSRYRWHNGQWWYQTQDGRWMYWSSNRWNQFDPQAYTGDGRTSGYRYGGYDYTTPTYPYGSGRGYQSGTYYDRRYYQQDFTPYQGYGYPYGTWSGYRGYRPDVGYGFPSYNGYAPHSGYNLYNPYGPSYYNRGAAVGGSIGSQIGGEIGGPRGAAIGGAIGAGVGADR